MGAEANPPRAVLLDALGTLLDLEPPAPHLVAELARRGVEVGEEEAQRAVVAEIGYYRANLHLGRDRSTLAVLRRRCAAVMAAQLPPAVAALGQPALVEVLLASLRFTAYPDAAPALADLRRMGLRLIVVSNWDCSLREVLSRTGLARHVHGAVASAELGAAKPDPAPFRHALAMAGVAPERARHVGDQLDADVAGARNAGIEPILIDRRGAGVPEGVQAIETLAELAPLLA